LSSDTAQPIVAGATTQAGAAVGPVQFHGDGPYSQLAEHVKSSLEAAVGPIGADKAKWRQINFAQLLHFHMSQSTLAALNLMARAPMAIVEYIRAFSPGALLQGAKSSVLNTLAWMAALTICALLGGSLVHSPDWVLTMFGWAF